MFKGFGAAINSAAASVGENITQASLSAELALVQSQITEVKAKWGRDSFDKFIAGDQAAVQSLAQRAQQEILALEKKSVELKAKKQATLGVASGQQGQQVQVQVPPGVAPGQQFQVTLPGGKPFAVIVPPGLTPGQSLLVTVPPGHAPQANAAAVPVVAGQVVGKPQ